MSSHGSATVTMDDVPEREKPQNGVAGLKHWRYDVMAGLQVAMMGIPLSLGIDAISIGAGGMGGGAHSLQEWYDATGREAGLKRALLTVLGISGVAEEKTR